MQYQKLITNNKLKKQIMLIVLNFLLCVFNLVITYFAYKLQVYDMAIFSAFAAGFTACAAIAVALMGR